MNCEICGRPGRKIYDPWTSDYYWEHYSNETDLDHDFEEG